MQRKEFLKSCGLGCLGLIGLPMFMVGCAGTKYINANLSDPYLEFDLSEFEVTKKDKTAYRSYVVVQHDSLKYPLCVYRKSSSEYKALLMRCTHQGTELQVFGDRLQCPAHGSEFTTTGSVQSGPADDALRSFPIEIVNSTLRINLS